MDHQGDHERVAGLTFYEAPAADRFLLGYMVDDEVPRFVCSGCDVNRAPGAGPTGPT